MARLTGYLSARADGNAFFMTQLLRALEGDQVLRPHLGGWKVGALDSVSVPLPLRQVIDGRTARLGEESQALLMAASVIGQDVPLDIWATVTEDDEERLLECIERATEAQLLSDSPGSASVRFVHGLVREALYEGW